MSNLVIQCAKSIDNTSSENKNEYFMMILFDVKGVIIRTRNFANLYDSGLIADG